jgi:hypothetical protein
MTDDLTKKIIEFIKETAEYAESSAKEQETFRGQIDSMAHVQGMIVKALAVQNPRIKSFFLENLEAPTDVLRGAALKDSTFDEYLAWMRQVVNGEHDGQVAPSRPPWLKEVIDGGKSVTSTAAPTEEDPPA